MFAFPFVLAWLAAEDATPKFLVEDTFLDVNAPTADYGRDGFLNSGPGRPILIRFVPKTPIEGSVKVTGAALVLHGEYSETPSLTSVGRLLASWGEGVGARGLLRKVDPKANEKGVAGSACWNARFGGPKELPWAEPGARGATDVANITGAVLSVESDGLVIGGLEEAVQAMLDDPEHNYGLRIEFAAPVQLLSSESASLAPELRVQFEPTQKPAGVDLALSQLAPKAGPLTSWPASGDTTVYAATATNRGDQACGALLVTWKLNERLLARTQQATRLERGASAEVEFAVPQRIDPLGLSSGKLELSVEPVDAKDAFPANNTRSTFVQAISISIGASEDAAAQAGISDPRELEIRARRVLDELVDHVFRYSRYSFAPNGVTQRLRLDSATFGSPAPAMLRLELGARELAALTPEADRTPFFRAVLDALGVPGELSLGASVPKEFGKPVFRYAGILGWGDTRDDFRWTPIVSVPSPLVYNLAELTSPMPVQGLLSGGAVAILQGLEGKLGAERDLGSLVPNSLLLRVLTPSRKPLRQGSAALWRLTSEGWQKGEPLDLDRNGSVLIPLADVFEFGSTAPAPFAAVRVTASGQTETIWLDAPRLIFERARTGQALVMLDEQVQLGDVPVDRDQDLAAGKIVTDSLGSFPAQTAMAVDEKPETGYRLKSESPSWIELDLGRDRTIGEIVLELGPDSQLPQKLEIEVYNTAQRVSDARTIEREIAFPWSFESRAIDMGQSRRIVYRPEPSTWRYLRLEFSEGANLDVRGLAVHPALISTPQPG